ncbi:hypothetical protein QEN19_003674 [Hanseniaspora menglaensis]
MIEQKILKKFQNILYIYDHSEFNLNLNNYTLNEKQSIYTNLTYIESSFHYNTINCKVDSKHIKNLNKILYRADYNIFDNSNNITTNSMRQVIRGLKIYFQRLINDYGGEKYFMEIIFNIWEKFNTVFTFQKMSEIKNKIKLVFPREGCSLSENFLQFKFLLIFDYPSEEENVLNCFYSLLYLFLLCDGIIFWDEYLEFVKMNDTLYKTLPLLISYNKLTTIFELLELVIFLAGQYIFKEFEELVQYIKSFSLVLFSLENCFSVANSEKFKDLNEFIKVTDTLSLAMLNLLLKYLSGLNESSQLKDFYLFDNLKDYLFNKNKKKKSNLYKKILILSQPSTKSFNPGKSLSLIISKILSNIKKSKQFINENSYLISDVFLCFLDFLPYNFDKFCNEMIVNENFVNKFLKNEQLYEDNDAILKKVIHQLSNMQKNCKSSTDLRGKELDYTQIEIKNVESWVIQIFEDNHPLIFPLYLQPNDTKIYQLKSKYAIKLDLSYVLFKLSKVEFESNKKFKKDITQQYNEKFNQNTSLYNGIQKEQLETFKDSMNEIFEKQPFCSSNDKNRAKHVSKFFGYSEKLEGNISLDNNLSIDSNSKNKFIDKNIEHLLIHNSESVKKLLPTQNCYDKFVKKLVTLRAVKTHNNIKLILENYSDVELCTKVKLMDIQGKIMDPNLLNIERGYNISKNNSHVSDMQIEKHDMLSNNYNEDVQYMNSNMLTPQVEKAFIAKNKSNKTVLLNMDIENYDKKETV